jgi:hypothetical protein
LPWEAPRVAWDGYIIPLWWTLVKKPELARVCEGLKSEKMTIFCVFSVKFSFFENLPERLIVLGLRGVVAFETLILGVSCFETLAGRGFAGCSKKLNF